MVYSIENHSSNKKQTINRKEIAMKKHQASEEIVSLTKLLFDEYKSLTLSPEIVAKLTNRSEVSLSRDRAEGIGIPCTKLGKNRGSDRVLYSIHDISNFIVSRKKKVHND